MAGQTPRHNGHKIEVVIEAMKFRILRQEQFSSAFDASVLGCRYGGSGGEI